MLVRCGGGQLKRGICGESRAQRSELRTHTTDQGAASCHQRAKAIEQDRQRERKAARESARSLEWPGVLCARCNRRLGLDFAEKRNGEGEQSPPDDSVTRPSPQPQGLCSQRPIAADHKNDLSASNKGDEEAEQRSHGLLAAKVDKRPLDSRRLGVGDQHVHQLAVCLDPEITHTPHRAAHHGVTPRAANDGLVHVLHQQAVALQALAFSGKRVRGGAMRVGKRRVALPDWMSSGVWRFGGAPQVP